MKSGDKSVHGQWQKVEEALAADIIAGRYAQNTQLPKESELMAHFSVGRHSVRRAIAQLQSKGLVQVEHGKGTFVRDSRVQYHISERTRFSQNLLAQGREPFGQSLQEEELLASARVSEALRIPTGEPVYHIIHVAYADEEPLNFSYAFYPVSRFPGFDVKRREGWSVSKIFAGYGIADYIRLKTDIFVRMPTEEEARLLQVPTAEPVIIQKKVDVDMKGVPVAYSESVWASTRVEFVVDNTPRLLEMLAKG